MVVRVENTKMSSTKSKKYVGNGLNIHLPENNNTVSVTGNDCRIKIDVNNGTLKIVGNSCHVQVSCGDGDIIYNGNEGRVRLGAEVNEKNVLYIGNDGKVLKAKQNKAKETKEDQKKKCSHSEKLKEEEIPMERTKRNSSNNYNINIVNKAHKQYSLSESMFSFAVPSVIIVPYVTESVIKIRKSKQ